MAESLMRRGLYLPLFGPFGDPNVVVDLTVRAEAAGWDGVFLWDHVVSDTPSVADPWTTLAAMAVATDRILLGPTVTPLPRRRPWVVARHASTVSRLSGGRLVLGAGLGSDEGGDFSRFGEPTGLGTRSAMLDEALTVVRAMWSGSSHDFTGAHYEVHVDAGTPEPHPIPVWIGCSARHPRVIARAIANDGIFPIADHTLRPDEIAGIVQSVRQAGLSAHRSFDVIVCGNASSAWERPNPDSVDLGATAKAGATWWLETLIHFDHLALSLEVVDAGPP